MENTDIRYIELTRSSFDHINDEDVLGIFLETRERIFSNLTVSEQCNFHHHVFDKEQTDKLFKTYDKLLVGTDDTLYGCIGNKQQALKSAEGLFEAAEYAVKL